MNLICPECKNLVDLTSYSEVHLEDIIECNMCGITLQISAVHTDTLDAEVVDEGK